MSDQAGTSLEMAEVLTIPSIQITSSEAFVKQ